MYRCRVVGSSRCARNGLSESTVLRVPMLTTFGVLSAWAASPAGSVASAETPRVRAAATAERANFRMGRPPSSGREFVGGRCLPRLTETVNNSQPDWSTIHRPFGVVRFRVLTFGARMTEELLDNALPEERRL